jgi:hypothetical protein
VAEKKFPVLGRNREKVVTLVVEDTYYDSEQA